MNMKKTPLFELHKNHGAKFVEFAGYEMPIQYKDGIIQEHKFTRLNHCFSSNIVIALDDMDVK